MLIETTSKYRTLSEPEAKQLIQTLYTKVREQGGLIKKAAYERKTKKSKGEIYIVTITSTFADPWEGIEDE